MLALDVWQADGFTLAIITCIRGADPNYDGGGGS